MATRTLIRNNGSAPLSLPFPLGGILGAGQGVVVDGTVAAVKAALGPIPGGDQVDLLEVTNSVASDPAFTNYLNQTLAVTQTQTTAIATSVATSVSTPIAAAAAAAAVAAIPSKVDVQVFSTPGTATWTKPTGAQRVDAYVMPPGGSGGSGRKSSGGTAASGGGGGCNGAWHIMRGMPAALLGATETVTIGAVSTGGAAQATADTNGNPGVIGGTTSFGAWISSPGANPGGGGTTTSAAGGSAAGGNGFDDYLVINPLTGASGVTGTGQSPAGATVGGLSNSGAGGGGVTAGGVAAGGAAGGATGFLAGGTAGTAAGNGGPGQSIGSNAPIGGSGGGSGGGAASGNAGDGGAGGFPGGGGGGGGGVQGTGNSGKGGDGGGALVIVVSYCT